MDPHVPAESRGGRGISFQFGGVVVGALATELWM